MGVVTNRARCPRCFARHADEAAEAEAHVYLDARRDRLNAAAATIEAREQSNPSHTE